MKRILLLIVFLAGINSISRGQGKYEGLVQFSGVVVTGDSLRPVPFVSIIIKNSFRGTISDYNGFFSFVAQMKDTIEFSAIGFKKGIYIIPDTLNTDRYSLIKIMTSVNTEVKFSIIILKLIPTPDI